MADLILDLVVAFILGWVVYKLVRRARNSLQGREARPQKRLFEREGSLLWEFWCDEWIVVVLMIMFLWWLMIPYYLFKWSYKYIYVPLDDKRQIVRLRKAVVEEKVKEKSELELLAQKLRDVAPKTPPEKMRATILLNTVEYQKGAFRHSVDMLVELSEQERAIVYEHQIDFIEIDDVPVHNQDALARMKYENQKEVDAISQIRQPLLKAITRQSMEAVNEMQKKDRLKTTVGDLLVVPYQRIFETAHEAKEHADKLKGIIYLSPFCLLRLWFLILFCLSILTRHRLAQARLRRRFPMMQQSLALCLMRLSAPRWLHSSRRDVIAG